MSSEYRELAIDIVRAVGGVSPVSRVEEWLQENAPRIAAIATTDHHFRRLVAENEHLHDTIDRLRNGRKRQGEVVNKDGENT